MNKSIINETQLQQMRGLFNENKDKFITNEHFRELLDLNQIGVRLGIRILRLEGMTIIANGRKGYSYTNNKEEIMKTALSLLSRGKKIVDVGNTMIRACHKDTPHYNLK